MNIRQNPGVRNDPKRLKTVKNSIMKNMQNGIHSLNQKKLNQSKKKNPQGKEAELDVLLTDASEQVHPIKLDALDADSVKRVAVKVRSGGGPSGLDADGWGRILITKQFGNSSSDLCTAIAELI